MRIRIRTTLLALAPFLAFAPTSRADPAAGGALYPPGLQPLIHRANTLFGLGQFSDAAKAYSEAIDQSPADYLLYYKRATAYFSLNRNAPALDDFTKVLALTGGTFDHAHLMSAKIHARDGAFDPALAALAAYSAASAKAQADPHARELHADIAAAAAAAAQAAREAHAQLWTACYESATRALRVAPYALPLRATRARCALKAGDVEAAVGDLARLSQLRPSPAPAEHLALFRLAYFFMPAPAGGAQAQNTALNALKACLNLDPDSGVCLPAHREMKALEKGFARAEALAGKQDWRGLLDHLLGKDRAGTAGFLRAFEDALAKHSARAEMAPTPTATTTTSSSSSKSKGAAAAAGEENPAALPVTYSPRLTRLLHLACSAHTALSSPKAHKRGLPYCERLVAQDPDLLGDAELDAGAAGRAEALMAAEEWEEAVRVLEGAWERSRGEDVKQRLLKAKRLLKQSRTKDYYKVLGVARDADAATIKKAYRKAAMKAHPDKGGSEAKMATVNEAYEVLKDPALRARFDAGEDPNDPMAQAGGFQGGGFPGGHPFAHFFQQGGGGGGFQQGSYGRGR